MMRIADWTVNEPFPEKAISTWHVYEAVPFCYRTEAGKLHEWTFWVHESLTKDQAMVKIMDGYAR